jgi:hypothetical protein
VLCTDLSTESDFCFIHHELIGFYSHVESVYCAVRANSLYRADYVYSLKGESNVNWNTRQKHSVEKDPQINEDGISNDMKEPQFRRNGS